MQTISWEDEIKLMDGVVYDIDFFQDFSSVWIHEHPIKDFSVSDLIKLIDNHKNLFTTEHYTPTAEDYRRSQELWEQFDEYEQETKRREAKWKKGKKKRKKRVKRFWKEIDSGEYFLK